MKKWFCFFLVLILVFSFSLPAFAFEVSKLQNAYNSLQQYLDRDYFEERPELDVFFSEMEQTKTLLARTDATEEEWEAQYDRLHQAYINLFHAAYDYSRLSDRVQLLESLDTAVFSEAEYAALAEEFEKGKQELTSPLIFVPSKRVSRDFYIEVKQKDIDHYADLIDSALRNQRFSFDRDAVSVSLYSSFLTLLETYFPFDLLSSERASSLKTQLEEARRIIQEEPVDPALLSERANEINDIMVSELTPLFDFSPVEKALKTLEEADEEMYTPQSWTNFTARLAETKYALSFPMILFDRFETAGDLKEGYQKWIQSRSEELLSMMDILVPRELYRELEDLCVRYENIDSDPRTIDQYLSLKNALADGRAVLAEENVESVQLRTAIKKVENAVSALRKAESYYLDQEKKAADDETLQIILVILGAFAVVGASVFLSVRSSFRKHGKTNWSR